MYESIEPVLADGWAIFYHPDWPIQKLSPVCDLAFCISECNQYLRDHGRDLSRWQAYHQDQIARLLLVNWIHGRLSIEPIKKPVLVHPNGDELVVDCGDTRLMALGLHDPNGRIGVVLIDRATHAQRYHDWIRIINDAELKTHAGFGPDADIFCRPATNGQAIEWLEIGDKTTAHHLHDIDQRVAMMQRYLDRAGPRFQFDQAWAGRAIDWTEYC